MTIDVQIRDENLQYGIVYHTVWYNKKAAKTPALSLCKIYKYEYLTGKEILPSDQRRVTEQARLTYFSLGNTLEK